jgi:hypothetical protein
LCMCHNESVCVCARAREREREFAKEKENMCVWVCEIEIETECVCKLDTYRASVGEGESERKTVCNVERWTESLRGRVSKCLHVYLFARKSECVCVGPREKVFVRERHRTSVCV